MCRAGGLRITKRLVLRRKGQKIRPPVFAAKPPLRVVGAAIKRLATPDEGGNDVEVGLHLKCTGSEPNPQLYTSYGVWLHDQRGREVAVYAHRDAAQRQGSGQIYVLIAHT